MKPFLTIIGTVCVTLGAIGIVLPLLPTTPFLLLAAACFAKSSDKFYSWLLNHKWFGGYIRHFRSKQGVPLRVKVKAVTVMLLTMGLSAYFLRSNSTALISLAACACGVTLFLLMLPSEKKE